MATHEVTFPIQDQAEILKLRAGDEVIVQGHIIGIRDRTKDPGSSIRVIQLPMDLACAFPLLHRARRSQAQKNFF